MACQGEPSEFRRRVQAGAYLRELGLGQGQLCHGRWGGVDLEREGRSFCQSAGVIGLFPSVLTLFGRQPRLCIPTKLYGLGSGLSPCFSREMGSWRSSWFIIWRVAPGVLPAGFSEHDLQLRRTDSERGVVKAWQRVYAGLRSRGCPRLGGRTWRASPRREGVHFTRQCRLFTSTVGAVAKAERFQPLPASSPAGPAELGNGMLFIVGLGCSRLENRLVLVAERVLAVGVVLRRHAAAASAREP